MNESSRMTITDKIRSPYCGYHPNCTNPTSTWVKIDDEWRTLCAEHATPPARTRIKEYGL